MEQLVCRKGIKCLALFSGGLDSILAVRLMQEEGIEVHAAIFRSEFFDSSRAEEAASSLKIPFRVEEYTETILSLLEKPVHGLGSRMNPCVDCRAGMLHRALRIAQAEAFRFILTGEVLDQRPMTQNMKALLTAEREAGCSELVLRPLSAKLLPVTRPERQGWIERERLFGIRGRGRKVQMALAAQLGISTYPQPAGGCLLTDPAYSARLRDLFDHEGIRDSRQLSLLRVGRHFRIGELKLIVGRNKTENEILEGAPDENLVLKCEQFPGPSAILRAGVSDDLIGKAASICAMYSDCPPGLPSKITVQHGSDIKTIIVLPAERTEVERLRIR